MRKLVREELKVKINKKCCLKARKWTLEKIRGIVVVEFNRLFDYVFALRSADPNGTLELMKDGCFLKGEILSVVGRDGNNQMFPIAWPLVEVENRDTWGWFMKLIQTDLNLRDPIHFDNRYAEGLIEEVQVLLPNVEHRFCARHVYANWKKSHKGGDLQILFWKCCKETTETEFHRNASRIVATEGVHSESAQPMQLGSGRPRGRTFMQGFGLYTNEQIAWKTKACLTFSTSH